MYEKVDEYILDNDSECNVFFNKLLHSFENKLKIKLFYNVENELRETDISDLIPILDYQKQTVTFYNISDNSENELTKIKWWNNSKNECPPHIIEIYSMLEDYCEIKKKTHWMSAKYYEHMERYFIGPSIVISTLSGIASFLASTEVPGQEGKTYLSITVGVMASISTLLQSFSNAYGYQAKSECHQNAAESYDQIITSLRFERINPQENCNSVEFIKNIQNQITDTKTRCKYIVPDWIEQEFKNKEFNNLTSQKKREIFKKMIELKSQKYINHVENVEYDKIDLKELNTILGFVKFDELEKTNCF